MFVAGNPKAATNQRIPHHKTRNEIPSTTSNATVELNPLNLRYPFRLNFYDKPPHSEVTIEEFESWAIDRLKILAEIENAQSRNKSFDEINKILIAKTRDILPLYGNTGNFGNVDVDQQRKKDHYSHFILRLAFCRSEELRNRFVNVETQLFRHRLEIELTPDRKMFVRSLKLDWEEASPEEMKDTQVKRFIGDDQCYKARWTQVPDLVSNRKVYLSKGYAFVPFKDQASLLLQEFSSKLLKALEVTSNHLPYMDEDSRLLPVLEHLSISFIAGITGAEFISTNPDGDGFTADMIDELAKKHFPPCMKHLWVLLTKDKHLKYGGRQQLQLFLKGIGLPIEEAIIFWRKAFSKIDDDKFRKDYKYGIRHNYGLEGSRKNYQPKSCVTIITGSVGPQESHGCPFKEFNQTNLVHFLNQIYNVDPKSVLVKDILEFKKLSHFHLACTALWEHENKSCGTKKGDGLGQGETVAHPNRYFEASYQLKKSTSTSNNAVQQ